MSPPRQFVAEVSSPERRRFLLSHTGVGRSSYGSFENLGWALVVERFDETSEPLAEWDVWEQALLQILSYEDVYASEPVIWRVRNTDQTVDLRSLQPAFDASPRFATALKTSVDPDGGRRVCFNLYDDGSYRFTLEERITDEKSEAWLPKEWSSDHLSLEAVERAARERFDWLR